MEVFAISNLDDALKMLLAGAVAGVIYYAFNKYVLTKAESYVGLSAASPAAA